MRSQRKKYRQAKDAQPKPAFRFASAPKQGGNGQNQHRRAWVEHPLMGTAKIGKEQPQQAGGRQGVGEHIGAGESGAGRQANLFHQREQQGTSQENRNQGLNHQTRQSNRQPTPAPPSLPPKLTMRKGVPPPKQAGKGRPARVGQENQGQNQTRNGNPLPGLDTRLRKIRFAALDRRSPFTTKRGDQQPGRPGNGIEQGQVPSAVMGEELGQGRKGHPTQQCGPPGKALEAQKTDYTQPPQEQMEHDQQVEAQRQGQEQGQPAGRIPQARKRVGGKGIAAQDRRRPQRNAAPLCQGRP